MSEAPKRLWLDWPGANKGEPVYDEPPENENQAGQTGYIRADLHAAVVAERDALAARVKELGDGAFLAFVRHEGATPSSSPWYEQLWAVRRDDIRALVPATRKDGAP